MTIQENTMTLEYELREIVCDSSPLAPEELTVTTPLFERGALDSLGVAELLQFVEQHIGRELTDAETTKTNFATIGQTLTFIATESAR